jgi:hypothetical protein
LAEAEFVAPFANSCTEGQCCLGNGVCHDLVVKHIRLKRP